MELRVKWCPAVFILKKIQERSPYFSDVCIFIRGAERKDYQVDKLWC
jgi:hypothetical protein